MITIFDFINDILSAKKGNLLDNVDTESSFNLYLINRWVSMYSPEYATITNNTVNWLYPIFDTKQEQYRFLLNILPSTYRKRINYIKKIKKPSQNKGVDTVAMLATNLELSKREINDYIDSGLVDIERYEKN